MVNTSEDFKRFDKKQLLRDEALEVLRAICLGEAASDPSVLNRFSVLSFPNLKSYKFLYWFCFAAVGPATGPEVLARPAATLAVACETWGDELPEALREAKYDAIKAAMFASSARERAEEAEAEAEAETEAVTDQRPALLPQQSAVVLHGAEVLTLAAFEARAAELGPDRCAADVRAGRVALAFCDPCTLPGQPGWPVRNLVSMVRHRWAPLWTAAAAASAAGAAAGEVRRLPFCSREHRSTPIRARD